MANITTSKLKMADSALHRLWLAARGDLEYLDCEAWEDDCAVVLDLVSESRDACWPELEKRARAKAKAEQSG